MARPTTGKFEVLILQAGGVTAAPVLQALRDKKFSPRITSDIAGLHDALEAMTDPMLVIEVGGDSQKTNIVLHRLQSLARQRPVPIVLIGSDVEQYERALDQIFPVATTLNIPYGAVEMLAAINYVTRTFQQRKASGIEPKVPPVVTEQPKETVPEVVFAQLQKLDLVGRSIGGEPLSGEGISEEFLRTLGMLPVRPAVNEVISKLIVEAGEWGGAHLLRISYMAQRIVNPLSPEAALLESLRAASFLFALGFAGSRPDLLRRSFFMSEDALSVRLRGELASKIKDSALSATQDLSLDKESKIISVLARMVAGEHQPSNDDLSIVASAIMAADAVDRICFGAGRWNPRRAYALLNRLKRGDMAEYPPTVLCCVVKLLAEAIASRTPVYLLPKELRRNKGLQAELMNQARQPVDAHERRVPLASLAPGMKLSRALIGLDGQQVLASDIRLDQDLIWRIWQLSAVRPLRSAVVLAPEQGE